MNRKTAFRAIGYLACVVVATVVGTGCQASNDGSGSSGLRCLADGGYPGASAEPLVIPADQPGGASEGHAALCIGVWTVAANSSLPSSGYVVTEESQTNGSGASYLLTTVTTNGQTVELGDAAHSSHVVAAGSGWVAWIRESIEPEPDDQPQLLVRDVTSGTDQIAYSGQYVTSAKTDDQWLVYAILQENPQGPGAIDEHSRDGLNTKLYAYNLDAGESTELTDRISVMSPPSLWGQFSISSGKIAWLERGEPFGKPIMVVRDMATGSQRQLDVELDQPEEISIFGDLVVWRDNPGWRGFSLTELTPFKIPTLSLTGRVYAAPSGVEWVLYENGGQVRYYRAEVLRQR